MAHTKQTACKSTGGKAPQKRLQPRWLVDIGHGFYWPETGNQAQELNLGPVKRSCCMVRGSNPGPIKTSCTQRAQKYAQIAHRSRTNNTWMAHRSRTNNKYRVRMTWIVHRLCTNKNRARIKQITHEQYILRTRCTQKIQITRNLPRGTCPADDGWRPDRSNFLNPPRYPKRMYQWIYLTKIKLRSRYTWRD